MSGPTSCGKTYFVKTLLQNCMAKISPPPQKIVWLYKRWQPPCMMSSKQPSHRKLNSYKESPWIWIKIHSSIKKGDTTVRAFKEVLRVGRKPSRLRTDKGQVFRSMAFNDALKERGINHFYSQNTEVKANFAERAIKTIKTRITRYMTYKQSSRYVDQLQTFAQSYNSTYHRTIDTRPESVKKRKRRGSACI